jgi:hypothetical protein
MSIQSSDKDLLASQIPNNFANTTGTAGSVPVRSGILIMGFGGAAFEDGTERPNMGFSTDGFNFAPIPINYTPPLDASSRQVGTRDTHVIKIGIYYLGSYTASNSVLGVEPYFGVFRSTDLVNWSHVTDVTTSGAIANPIWFSDPPTGKLYVSQGDNPGGNIFITENTSKDGATWGTGVMATFVGGSPVVGAGAQVLYISGTYNLIYVKADGFTYYSTSSSLTTGYTEIGKIAPGVWPTSDVGIIIPTPEGTYRAYLPARSGPFAGSSVYSTSTTGIGGTWTAPVQLAGFAGNWDNAGGFAVTDAGTFRDAQGAINQMLPFPGSMTNPLNPLFNVKGRTIYNSQIQPAIAGLGTIAISGNTVTGASGSRFLSQLSVGSTLIYGVNLRVTVLEAPTSDTSVKIMENRTASAVAYTIIPPLQTLNSDWGSNIITGDGANYCYVTNGNKNNGTIYHFNGQTSSWSWIPNSVGQFVLSSFGTVNNFPFFVNPDARNTALNLTINGATFGGRIVVNGAADDGSSAIVAAGNIVASGTVTSNGGKVLTLGGSLTTSGAFATTLTATGTTTLTLPTTGTLSTTSNNLGAFASTTSAQLAGVISDETGTGALVFAGSPAFSGTPTAPTAAPGTNTGQIATAAFVTAAITAGPKVNVLSGTLAAGSATVTVPAGISPWVQDTNTSSLTNVGSLTCSVSGTTATVKSTNALDTSTFNLFYWQ